VLCHMFSTSSSRRRRLGSAGSNSPMRAWAPPLLTLILLPFAAVSLSRAQTLVVSPSSVTFNAVADSTTSPPAQTVQVSASDGSHVPFTLYVPVPPPYQNLPPVKSPFTFNLSSQTTPATVTIGFTPAQAIINNYQWPVRIGQTLVAISSAFPAAPEVDLFVGAELSMPPPPVITAVVNQASQLPGVSPGELILVLGTYLGADASGLVCSDHGGPPCYYASEAGGTTVTLNGVPAPVISIGPTAAIVMVPYNVTGQTVDVTLTHYGQTAATVRVALAVTSPGVYPDSLLNDDQTRNGPSAPEPAGSALSLTATGFGIWNQPGLIPAAPISVSIGGQPAQIKAEAPPPISVGQLALTVVIPPGLAAGPQPLVFTAGNNDSSQQKLNVYVGDATPVIHAVSNAASFAGIAQAPGTLVSIYGTYRDSAPQIAAVSFDGIPAPVLYAGPAQINSVIPFELSGHASAMAMVSVNGLTSAPYAFNLTDTSPSIFRFGVLNQDSSQNSADNPAAAGSVLQIFATGAGVFIPPLADGSIVPIAPPYPVPAAPVSVSIGGLPAQIEYAGAAPALVAGMLQVNAVVPASLNSGIQRILLTVGRNTDSLEDILVFVK